jgi:hypothetical protein
MKKKTIILSAILLLLSSFSLYSAQDAESATIIGASTVSDAEWGWPEKFKISYKWFTPFKGFLKFHIIGKVLSYNDNELVHMVSLTDPKTKKLLRKIEAVYNKRMKKEEGLAIFQAFVDSFNAFLTSGTPESMKLKEYLKNMYFRSKARKNDRHNRIEHFIGIKTLLGCDLGIGLRFGFFFPGDQNLKLGFLTDFIYRKNISSTRMGMRAPRLLGWDLMAAMKIKGFYWGTGGFIHLRISNEIVYGYHETLYVKPLIMGSLVQLVI